MSPTRSSRNVATLRRVLAVSVCVELVTSVALVLVPSIVVRLLLGADLEPATAANALARLFGIVLLSLVITCWPAPPRPDDGVVPAFRGMLFYNGIVTLFFAYLWLGRDPTGVLLLPAGAFHAVVSVLLVACRP